MMSELVTRNLLHRPLRTLIGVMAVAVEVALVLLIVGLTSGLLNETAKRIEGIGADIMLQPPAASIFLGFSGSPMPIKIGDKLAQMKYVQAVAPGLLQFNYWAAKAKHLKVGDSYNLLNHDWHIVAIIEHGKGARLFVPISTLQD